MEYSQKLQRMEIQKLKRQDMENEAIIKSLNVISKRKMEELSRPKSSGEKGDLQVESGLGKRGNEEFQPNQPKTSVKNVNQEKGTEVISQVNHEKEKLEMKNEVDRAKIETVFNQQIYKLRKQKEIQNELYNSESFAVNSSNYKRNYYVQKFGVTGAEFHPFVNSLKLYYIEGIIWNYHYYYKGCVSWDWFFPYYYAPLLSDLKNFAQESFDFKMNEPFNPCEQLLSVLPPFSSHALPKCLQHLLHNDDSEIIDFYPTDFHIGKLGEFGRKSEI